MPTTPTPVQQSPEATRSSNQPKYSDTTKKIIFGMARMMGYYTVSSTAIRVSKELYAQCAKQAEQRRNFYISGMLLWCFVVFFGGCFLMYFWAGHAADSSHISSC